VNSYNYNIGPHIVIMALIVACLILALLAECAGLV